MQHIDLNPGFAARMLISAEDWPALAAGAAAGEAQVAQARADHGVHWHYIRGVHALALAHMGRAADAAAVLAATPLDCQPCVLARAWTAEVAGQRAEADHWFGEAARMAPSLPDARQDWGRALFARGQVDAAIVQFKFAAAIQPKWADPRARWGEALLAKGDAGGAVEQFRAAAPLAPRWGRLHLKWGEALARLGKTDEAQAQWRLSGGMDLRPDERAELATRR
jgi:tetratricopeptide (TPR) repeat protein